MKNLIVILLNFGRSKKLVPLVFTKLPYEKLDPWATLTLLLTGCLSIQFFDSTPFSQHSQLGCFCRTTRGCAVPVWFTERHGTPLVTRCFPPQPLTSSLTLPWTIARFLDLFYTFSPAHPRVICDFVPTQPLPRDADDIPRGERYFKHVPLLTYLIYLSPKEYISRFYLRARADQLQNIKLHRKLVLRNASSEISASCGVRTLFTVGEYL